MTVKQVMDDEFRMMLQHMKKSDGTLISLNGTMSVCRNFPQIPPLSLRQSVGLLVVELPAHHLTTRWACVRSHLSLVQV
ncbi:hypothetical protein E2C01_024008 [Portunus trituberculatus]|uniref:Uncharacterized protein n=1 Tax=Portunus trituberculatus TaxID=210409 RepID=A0A5B7EAR8_PORTR|nr:hypothetical protein [Portunus trituberculatus]